MARLFTKEEVIRPLTLAVFAVIIILVIVIRIRGSFLGTSPKEDQPLTANSFQALVDSYYPSADELTKVNEISITNRQRASESIHFIARDGFFVQAYVSKPEGNGPFPYIIIVPDSLAGSDALKVSQTLGELYATSLHAAVIVIDPRVTHRGVDDVADVIAAVEWQKEVQQIDGQPQFLIGIGYGAWLSLKASATTALQNLVLLSPMIDFDSENAKETIRNNFIAQSDCESVASQEACFAELSSITFPKVATYVQVSSSEAVIRSTDIDRITAEKLADVTLDTIDGDISLRAASTETDAPILTGSLQSLSAWLTPHITTHEAE